MDTKLQFILQAAGLMLAACNGLESYPPNPNNPPEQALPESSFTLKVVVYEPGIIQDSTFRYEGLVRADCPDGKVAFTSVTGIHGGVPAKTFSVDNDVVELVLTPWNSISFEASAAVNASSSTNVADIVKDGDLQHYKLRSIVDKNNPRSLSAFDSNVLFGDERRDQPSAIVEGFTDLKFWNGNPDTGKHITVRIRMANHIAVEGFEIALDGERKLLREYPKGTVAADLWQDANAYLFRLPNIAKPMEEYYVRGKTDYLTEEIYDVSKFKVIEFIGTVPRNATPDNRVTQKIDAVSFKAYGIPPKNDYSVAYIWSSQYYPEFRWMPYRKETQYNREVAVDPSLAGQRSYRYYPADLRYRKAKIWNWNEKETPDGQGLDYFIYYTFTPNADDVKDVRYHWGKIKNELAK